MNSLLYNVDIIFMEERFALLLYFVFQVLRTCEIFSRRNYKFI